MFGAITFGHLVQARLALRLIILSYYNWYYLHGSGLIQLLLTSLIWVCASVLSIWWREIGVNFIFNLVTKFGPNNYT